MAEIIAGDSYVHPIKKSGNTGDIIAGIMDADKCNTAYVTEFARELQGNTKLETCENIYNFVRANIPYNEDEEGQQLIKSPGEVWNCRYQDALDADGNGGTGEGCDCKSMSIFCSALLKAMGNYEFMYRFVSETLEDDLYHVYAIVRDDGGEGYIVLDCTLRTFNKELQLAKYMDVEPAPASASCPFPGPARIGAVDPEIPVADITWINYVNEYKRLYGSIADKVKADCLKDVEDHFSGQPVRRAAARGIFYDHWASWIIMAQCMTYRWFDLNKVFITSPYGVKSALQQLYPGIGAKFDYGDTLRNTLSGIGIKDENLKRLTSLGVYNSYGIPLDYMLYRCYAMINYGQPWEPVPGYPYVDMRTKTFVENGAPEGTAFKIALCLPYGGGGFTRPYGQPYWSAGGWIMANGATAKDLNKFRETVPSPIPEITAANAGNTALIAQNISFWTRWINGNMPGFPGAVSKTGEYAVTGHRIGEVAVTAIIGAILAVATFVLGLLDRLGVFDKDPPTGAQIPQPPPDFNMEYQSADGCWIGSAPASCPGYAKAKYCPDGRFECLTATELELEINQPGYGNHGGGEQKKKGLLIAGIALLALGIFSAGSSGNKKSKS